MLFDEVDNGRRSVRLLANGDGIVDHAHVHHLAALAHSRDGVRGRLRRRVPQQKRANIATLQTTSCFVRIDVCVIVFLRTQGQYSFEQLLAQTHETDARQPQPRSLLPNHR